MQISLKSSTPSPTISELLDLFSEYGVVEGFKIVSDQETGRTKILGVSH